MGIGFAVASRLAKPVIAQLRDFGRTREVGLVSEFRW